MIFAWQFNFNAADISNEILKDFEISARAFNWIRLADARFRMHEFVHVLKNEIYSQRNSYLVSSSAAAKTEPVAPLALREIHAVFFRVHWSFASRC